MSNLFVVLVATWGVLLVSCSGIEGAYPAQNIPASKGRSGLLTPPGIEGRGTLYTPQRNGRQSGVDRAHGEGAEGGSYAALTSESKVTLFDSQGLNSFHLPSGTEGSNRGFYDPLGQSESTSSAHQGALRGEEQREGGYEVPPSLRSDDLEEAEASLDLARLAEALPGAGFPGEDYTVLYSVPDTPFSCEDQEYPGYYADTAQEAGCQVFHICHPGGRKDSFLCPVGTLFRQEVFVCDWWFNVDCTDSPRFFRLNQNIGRLPGEADDLQERAEAGNGLYATPEEETPFAPPTRGNGGSDQSHGYQGNGFFLQKRQLEKNSRSSTNGSL